MSDAKQRPDTIKQDSPKDQVGADKGAIKGPQRTDHNTQKTDLARGAQGDVRRTSNGAR